MSEDKKVRFKKRFIFLGILGFIIVLVIFDRLDYKKMVEGDQKTEETFNIVLDEADSALMVLDNANNLIDSLKQKDEEGRSEIDNLSEDLKNKKITLSEYTKKMEDLIKEANDAKKIAEDNKKLADESSKIAEEVSKRAQQAKMVADRSRSISQMRYKKLQDKYNNLLTEYKKLSTLVDSSMVNESIVNDSIIKDDKEIIPHTNFKTPKTKKGVKFKSSGNKKRGRGKKF